MYILCIYILYTYIYIFIHIYIYTYAYLVVFVDGSYPFYGDSKKPDTKGSLTNQFFTKCNKGIEIFLALFLVRPIDIER